MAWRRRRGDKPLSEPMVIILLTPIWVTLRQCVKDHDFKDLNFETQCRMIL